MIILIGGEKGGSGKTTLVTNLIAQHIINGKDTLLVDTDKQGSASAWAATREDTNLKRVSSVQKFGKTLTAELRELSTKYEDIFVDAGGRDSVELRAAMVASDRIYIPLCPSQIDVWTLPRMIELVEETRMFNEKLQAYFVINRGATNPSVKEVGEVRELVGDIESITLCDSIIRDRIAFRKAPKSGMGVIELERPDKDEKAIAEVKAFYQEIFNDN